MFSSPTNVSESIQAPFKVGLGLALRKSLRTLAGEFPDSGENIIPENPFKTPSNPE